VGTVSIGVDVGQKRDPSAIVVAEAEGQDSSTVFVARHIENLLLATPYPQVAARVAEIVSGIQDRVTSADSSRLRNRLSNLTLTIDATGVGRPVVELILEALPKGACRVRAATFTHGDRLTKVDGELRVGKAYLVSRLQALLQTGRIKLPRTRQAEELAEELLDYEIKVDHNANDTYGAFRVGTHDDLVTALGLAVLSDYHPPRIARVKIIKGPGKR
jgi:hypothetical protein